MLGIAHYHTIPLLKGLAAPCPFHGHSGDFSGPRRGSNHTLSSSNLTFSAPLSFAGPLHQQDVSIPIEIGLPV